MISLNTIKPSLELDSELPDIYNLQTY